MSEIPVTELQTLEPSAVIELFELDATSIGGDILYFHAGTNELSQNIVWNGQTYVRYPILISGFEISGDGAFPRPKFTVSNALSAISTVLQLYEDLIGAKVTRKRTLKKFLDAENFTGGVNPDADPTAEFPSDIYFIDRKSREDNELVEFELASAIDLAGIKLPRRQIIQNVCVWRYRGADCGYTGAPLYDINDERIQGSSQSSEAQAVLTTQSTLESASLVLAEAETDLSSANALQAEMCAYELVETRYEIEVSSSLVIGEFVDGVIINEITHALEARWDGIIVTLGLEYRKGKVMIQNQRLSTWKIERWEVDSAACADATADASTALAARDAAQASYDIALDAFETAFAALPEDDPIYTVDRCGKRLTSCKLRFGENNPLPFGSFPSASLIK